MNNSNIVLFKQLYNSTIMWLPLYRTVAANGETFRVKSCTQRKKERGEVGSFGMLVGGD